VQHTINKVHANGGDETAFAERLRSRHLRDGDALFQQIQDLCENWIDQVTGLELERQAALALLLSTLEVALDPDSGEL
jgi:hypothetical protein